MTLQQFWDAGGYEEMRKALAPLKHNLTAVPVEDLLNDGAQYLLENFTAIMAKHRKPGYTDCQHLLGAGVYAAKRAVRSKLNDYHEQGYKRVRNVRQSDCEAVGSFEPLFGLCQPKVRFGNFFGNLSPELHAFVTDLCHECKPLFDDLVVAFDNPLDIPRKRRDQIKYALEVWRNERRIPNPKHVAPFEVPKGLPQIPYDAEILHVGEDGYVHYTSPELIRSGKTKTVSWEYETAYTDENGNEVVEIGTETVVVPDDYRFVFAYASAAT